MNKGLIRMTDQLYRVNYEIVSGIFKYFRPTHIEYRHWDNIWHLYGESDLFSAVKEGEETPEYVFLITQNTDKSYSYTFKGKA